MKKAIKIMWLDVICVIVGVLSFSLNKVSYNISMIFGLIFSILYMINLLHCLYNRKYFTNFLCNLVMIGNLIIMYNAIMSITGKIDNSGTIALTYVMVSLVLGNILDMYVHTHNMKIKSIEFNLLTKNNKYLMLINLVNIFLVLLFQIEVTLQTKSVLFLFVLFLILIIPLIYYIKRKHYICATTIGLDLLANYIILIVFTIRYFMNIGDSMNQLLMPCLYGVMLIPLSILPIIFIKYKKEYITL